ncbi:MAG: type II toxin-antitoxin system VapC family toxin [Alphaproteobacteria bacterium]|nr:type II toxin-antitoxin system VapC family toxin [Alphaproteobacteria bacterium]
MKITPDTNVLVRVLVSDDPKQSRSAEAMLENAELVALTLPALCECVWVLSRGYTIESEAIADRIRKMTTSANVVANRAAVDAGLQMMADGGDFADGVIAYEGRWSGGETFVTFDKRAAKLLEAHGRKTRVPV